MHVNLFHWYHGYSHVFVYLIIPEKKKFSLLLVQVDWFKILLATADAEIVIDGIIKKKTHFHDNEFWFFICLLYFQSLQSDKSFLNKCWIF